MNKFKDKIQQKWDEDPMQVIVVGALAATAAAKLIDAMSDAQWRRAYALESKYRVNN